MKKRKERKREWFGLACDMGFSFFVCIFKQALHFGQKNRPVSCDSGRGERKKQHWGLDFFSCL